jgi:hypothetical protein
MKKVVRLTERDLTRIVKRVIRENEMDEMMDVSSDSEYYQGRKREQSLPGDELGLLLSLSKRWCESQGVKMGESLDYIEQNAPADCYSVAKLNRTFNFL